MISEEEYILYVKRTIAHIHIVQRNMELVVTLFRRELSLTYDDCRQLLHNVMKHDRSKFSSLQFEPYIELTKYYRERKVLGNKDYKYPTPEVKDSVDHAVKEHYFAENHHPERLRDSIDQRFSKYEAIETVCDLQAMAEEFNEGSCRGYFESVWKVKQIENFPYKDNWQETLDIMNNVIKCFDDYLRGAGNE